MSGTLSLLWRIVVGDDRWAARTLAIDVVLVAALQLLNVHCLYEMLHAEGDGSATTFGLLLISLAMTTWCLDRLEERCIAAFDDYSHARSVELIGRFSTMNLLDFERLDRARIPLALTVDLESVRALGISMSGVFTGLVTSAVSLLYVGLLSRSAGLVALVWMGLVAINTFVFIRTSRDGRRRMRAHRLRLTRRIRTLVSGFGQVRLHRERSDDLQAALADDQSRFRQAVLDVESARVQTLSRREAGRLSVLVAIGFGMPLAADDGRALAASALFIALFALRYVLLMAAQMVTLGESGELFERVDEFDALVVEQPTDDAPAPPTVGEITLHDLWFRYPEDGRPVPFELGPLDLTVRAGEVLFVVGANGSGKSSLIKLLAGLFPIGSGRIELDGRPLPRPAPQWYRELFSIIYADPAVHARLYGLDHITPGQIERVLRRLGLEDIVESVDGRWSRVELSTGQRKRLSMAVALLEDRPICIFDEWAADQDPDFKVWFYETLLPALSAQGKAVVVVSHDDRWFHCADRLVSLRAGRLDP